MDVATQFHFYLLTGGNVTAAFLAQRSSEPTGPLVCPFTYISCIIPNLPGNKRGVDNCVGQFEGRIYKDVISKLEKLNRGASLCV